MKVYPFYIIIFSIIMLPYNSFAKAKDCTSTEGKKLSTWSSTQDATKWTWDSLYQSFTDTRHCSAFDKSKLYVVDLEVAYTEAVKYLLIENWINFNKFIHLAKKNNKFKEFVFFISMKIFLLSS